jgi:hypothetical protein
VGHGGRTLFDSDVFRRCGGFVEGIEPAEDRDLWMLFARIGPAVIVPDIVLDKRTHAGQHPNPEWDAFALDVVRRRLPDLTEREQRVARRIIRARSHYTQGIRRLQEGRTLAAVGDFAWLAVAPWRILSSPLFRRQLTTHLRELVGTSSAPKRREG